MMRLKLLVPCILLASLGLFGCEEDRPETLEARASEVNSGILSEFGWISIQPSDQV